MRTIEKNISPLVESQFPDFYKEQGPLFILFVEEYFKWMEANDSSYANYSDALADGNPNYHIRRLLEYRDIDSTIDEFLVRFKEKYLKNVDTDTNVSQRRLIKAAQDIFSSKGTERSIDLLFKLIYGVKVEIYAPGDNILKASDGTWVKPVYLELAQKAKNATLPNKQITGSSSGATAFVESVVTRNINGKFIDIAFLSNVRGNFFTNEIVFEDGGIIEGSPKVIGSLTSIDITTPGELFSVGEIVSLLSPNGVEGRARVTAVDDVTGIVRFNIIDSGWGYSITANTFVSEKNIAISNVTNSNSSITTFERFETVNQNLYSFSLTNVTGEIGIAANVINGNTSAPSLSIAVDVAQNTATSANTANLILNQISSNVFSNNILIEKNRSFIATNTSISFNLGDQIIQRTGSSNNTLGVVSNTTNVTIISVNTSTVSSNGLHVGTYIEQSTTNAKGIITLIPRENNHTFTNVNVIAVTTSNGTFSNTNSITVYDTPLKVTNFGTFTPTASENGYLYLLIDTNLTSNTRWSTGNTAVRIDAPTINASIVIASDIGGLISSCTNISATGTVIGSNSSTIGLNDVNNAFYATGTTLIYGLNSNTYSNTLTIYRGQNASFDIGSIDNVETVRLSPDFISSNNDGPGSNSVKFSDMLISGANSTFGNLSAVYIASPGTGYNNSDIVVFTGGNTGVGSFQSANASILTNSSGSILSVALTANTGNGIITTPSVSVTNSTGGATLGTGANLVPASSLGFTKLPVGDITTRLIDLLTFNTLTIGSISSLSGINPGEQYNANPFALAIQKQVAAYDKRDSIVGINITSGPGFITNEVVEQTINEPGIEIVSNNITGNTSYEPSEQVYSTDGISNVATGIIYSTTNDLLANSFTTVITSNTGTWQNTITVSTLTVSSNANFNPGNKILQSTTANGILVTSNSTTLIVRDVQGTFTAGAVTSNATPTSGSTTISSANNTSKIYSLIGATSNATSSIIDTDAYTASTFSRGIVKTGSTASELFVKRVSLFSDYIIGETIVGKTSGTIADITSVSIDSSTRPVGDNATISANVVASNGAIAQLQVINSGFGYNDLENLTISSLDGARQATGKANVAQQGIGEGFYSSVRGFLNDNMFIQDGNYYQNFSYEVRTSIPLDKYSSILKELLHVAGKKYFGRVQSQQIANVSTSITATITTS